MAYKKRNTLIALMFLISILFTLNAVSVFAIQVDNVASREISIATMSNRVYAIAYVSQANISYAIFNTDGTTIFPKTNILSNIGANARVKAKAINSTAFMIAYYSDTSKNLSYQLFDISGNNISSPQILEPVGTATTDRVDFGIAPDLLKAYIGYGNDIDDDTDLRNITYTNLGAGSDTIVDLTNNFAQPMFQYISPVIINSTTLGYWYNDDADNDATFILINTQTNGIISTTDRDGNMGNGQIRATSMYNNLTAGLWFDQSDANIYFEILNSNGGAVYSASSQDNNAGADSRVAITTTTNKQNNQSVFIIGWNDRNSDSIEARVLSHNGTLLYNYTLASNEQTTNLFFSLEGRNDYLNTGICEGTYMFAYTNTSNSIISKQLFINGTETDGLCDADLINPNATLLQPVDNLYTNVTLVNFTISATDNVGLSNITLYVYNGTALITQQTQSVSGTSGIFGTLYNFLTNDIFTWFYNVVDIAGNIFTTENRTIIVDTIYPQLAIIYPVDLVNYDYIVSNITHVVNETNLANCTFSNGTITNIITCNAPYYFNSSEGNNFWYITATDLVGQSYVKPVTFLVDTIYPQIQFSGGTPTNNSVTSSNNLFINVTINETNFYSIRYVIANQTDIINDITFFTPITSASFINHTQGVYTFNVTIEDIVGHIATTETRTYTIDNTPPSLIVNSPIATNYTNNTILVNLTTDGFQTFFTDGGLEEYFLPVYRVYPEGYFNFSAIAVDSVGNENITYVYFFVDSQPPSISFVNPTETNNATKSINTIRVNVSVIEASFQNVTIKLYNSTHNEIASATSLLTPSYVEFTNLTNGIYYFNATACDIFNTCSDSQTRKVTIDQTLNASLSLTLIVPQYPYVDVNVTYPIKVNVKVGNVIVTDSITTITIRQLNGTNQTINLPFNSTSGYYETSVIFNEAGDFPFTIRANSSSYGYIQDTGTFLARSPFYLTISLYDQDTHDLIINDFAYISAEYVGNRQIDEFVEPFVYPIADNRFVAKSFHAPYINGQAILKLYEPQRDYIFRYFDGVVNFDGEYSAPNITKSYGTQVYLGTIAVNGTNGTYQFVLSEKDQNPYRWLFNWGLIIGLVLILVIAGLLFFMFPQYPFISLVFGIMFPLILLAIRLIVWWYWGW